MLRYSFSEYIMAAVQDLSGRMRSDPIHAKDSQLIARRRYKRKHKKESFLVHINGSTFRKTVFTVLCLIGFIGSSFGPVLPGGLKLASFDSRQGIPLDETSGAPEEEEGLYYHAYEVLKGDTVSDIAQQFGITQDSILSMNSIQSAKGLKPGQLLKVPNMAGIVYKASRGETVAKIAQEYKIEGNRIIDVNHLLSETMEESRFLFLPDARLPATKLKEIQGELFRWPVRGRITSWFGWRSDPFTGRRTYHNAIDIAAPMGTSMYAANDGVITDTGYSPVMGRYVMIRHANGWSSFYGHMSAIAVSPGQQVSAGKRIGSIGSTGYSTGPHVHFSIFRNGKPVNPTTLLK